MAKTRTVIKYARNLTPEEYKACKNLNYRQNGNLLYDIVEARKERDSRVIMIKNEDGRLLGWSLVHQGTTQLYVRKDSRRRGLGKRLMRQSLKIEPNPITIPHDRVSGAFFKNYLGQIKFDPWAGTYIDRT